MDDFLSARRSRLSAELDLRDALLLVGAGEPIPLPEGSDQTYPFRSHSEYFYLVGQECPGGIIAYDPRDAADRSATLDSDPIASQPDQPADTGWISFVPDVTENERVWEGRTQPPGAPVAALEPWLGARRGRPIAMLGAPVRGLCPDEALSLRVRGQLTHSRRPKDPFELDRIRRAAFATAAGFARLRGLIRPGVTERTLQIELEAEFFRAGGMRTGYGTLVGSGPNSAILHCDPSPRAVRPSEFVLVDAGAEIDRYMADVTRTYVAGEATGFQRDLYQIVLAVEERAITRCLPGAEWRELHLSAAVELTTGLVDLGILRGAPESLVEQEAHLLFFPHGLGHMVGLGVRDGSGMAPGRVKDSRPGLKNLRMDLPLQPGYVVTVEPGLYFIPALLNDQPRRERYRSSVDWDLVDRHLTLGGVRIEDNVLVTDGAPEVLTSAIPKNL